ncbi:MAG: histidine kinase [Bacteroidetes bacterium HGW-Bacteroidetes-9]|jgi:GAF domain-containing protein|nr:MAG: histidine kinase [Bacteroidetes bacterium HGW-Bacteroidetes-9]
MDKGKKEGRYLRLYAQLADLLKNSPDQISKMATITAILSNKMDYFFWCGFYRVDGNRLIVGPYQGPVACQVLEGRGVCLAAVEQQKTIVVADVHNFPGHIACDSRSLSEIVVPVKDSTGKITAVLDVDSKELGSFDETDAFHLEKIVKLLA